MSSLLLVSLVVDESLVHKVNAGRARYIRDSAYDLCLHVRDENQGSLHHPWDQSPSERQQDHSRSCAVAFLSETLDGLATLFLEWAVTCCSYDQPAKPTAYLSQLQHAISKGDLLQRCEEIIDTGEDDVKSLLRRSFDSINFFECCPTYAVEVEVMNTWFEAGAAKRAIRFWAREDGDFVRVLTKGVDEVLFRTTVVTITAAYLAWHTMCSQAWRSRPRSQHFTAYHFEQRYSVAVQTVLHALDLESPTVAFRRMAQAQLYKSIFTKWLHLIDSVPYACTMQSTFSAHLNTLGQHREFLHQRSFGLSCATCLSKGWQALLPCNHGICNTCLLHLEPSWRKSATASVNRCPLCQTIFLRPRQISVRPPAARGRSLALDGGGTRGIVQLLVLHILEESIGLGLPISRFFDDIVGTSIGGINALGLGDKGWSVGKCQDRLSELALRVFKSPTHVLKAVDLVTRGWTSTVLRALCVLFNTPIYDSRALEHVLKEVFGSDTQLLRPREQHVEVAVTTTSPSPGRGLHCQIFTTYNKAYHPTEEAYTWAFSNHSTDSIPNHEVWKAARYTSAAPFFFAPPTVGSSIYYDGALLHNDPVAIAVREASVKWSCPPEENIVVSVGCGETQFVPGGNRLWNHLYEALWQKTSPAQEERGRQLMGISSRNRKRLDPVLQVDSISLDDIRTMLSLQSRIDTMIRSDMVFMAQLRECALQLVASTYFCDQPSDEATESDTLTVAVYSRLGSDALRVAQKWPHACFVVDQGEVCVPITQSPCLLTVTPRDANSSVSINIMTEGKAQVPISGFPVAFHKLCEAIWPERDWCLPGRLKRSHEA